MPTRNRWIVRTPVAIAVALIIATTAAPAADDQDEATKVALEAVAKQLGVSPDTLYKYVGEQKIPAFKLGNRWRFKKSKLDQWMEEKSSQMEAKSKRKPKAAAKAAGQS